MRRAAVAASLGLAAAPPPAWAAQAARIWLPETASTVAPAIDRVFGIVLAITGAAFVLVQVTLVWFLLRYRRRPGVAAGYTHGNTVVEIIWTIIPALILVWLTFQSQRVWATIHRLPDAPDLEVEITGEQFVWNIRYAGPDGAFKTADDITTINQLHLPVQQTAVLHLTSKDVIHSFFVPQFRVKRDAVPGFTSRLWITPTRAGHYEIACAELCGLGHYRMRGFLVLEPPEAFDAWLQTQAPAPAAEPAHSQAGHS